MGASSKSSRSRSYVSSSQTSTSFSIACTLSDWSIAAMLAVSTSSVCRAPGCTLWTAQIMLRPAVVR
eukprot:scaffold63762_cov35-Tisochrysis_lutea.AAC.1